MEEIPDFRFHYPIRHQEPKYHIVRELKRARRQVGNICVKDIAATQIRNGETGTLCRINTVRLNPKRLRHGNGRQSGCAAEVAISRFSDKIVPAHDLSKFARERCRKVRGRVGTRIQ